MGCDITSAHAEAVVRPIPAAIAVVFRDDQVLLVRRANPPDVGLWGFPGGKIEFGESLENAAVRELLEETGVKAEALRVFTAVDAFDHDSDGCLLQHFLLVAVLCKWVTGEPVAADDALEAKWFAISEFMDSGMELSLNVAQLARDAYSIHISESAMAVSI